jgi:hypothetical protein
VNSGIYYDDKWGMWFGKNIRITPADKETIDIDDQLKRYEGKGDIKNDSEVYQLVDTIVDRNRPREVNRAILLLVKFGRAKYDFMQAQENPHFKKALAKKIIPYYQRAVDIADRNYDMNKVIERIKELAEMNE